MNRVEQYKSMTNKGGGKSTRQEKEELLKQMTNEEIDEIIDFTDNLYGKIWLSKFKKKY